MSHASHRLPWPTKRETISCILKTTELKQTVTTHMLALSSPRYTLLFLTNKQNELAAPRHYYCCRSSAAAVALAPLLVLLLLLLLLLLPPPPLL